MATFLLSLSYKKHTVSVQKCKMQNASTPLLNPAYPVIFIVINTVLLLTLKNSSKSIIQNFPYHH